MLRRTDALYSVASFVPFCTLLRCVTLVCVTLVGDRRERARGGGAPMVKARGLGGARATTACVRRTRSEGAGTAMRVRRCACVMMACAEGDARMILVCVRRRCVRDGGALMINARCFDGARAATACV